MTAARSPLVRLSVIVPAYNAAGTITRCLAAARMALREWMDIVVVDDGSTDGTAAIAEAAGVRVIRTPGPKGCGAARNQGARQAEGAILFFLDADIMVQPDTFDIALETLDREPGLTAMFGSYAAHTPAPGVFTQYKNLLHHFTHQTSAEDAATLTGGFSAIRRDVFRELGGFTTDRSALEDIDFGYRLFNAGHRVRLVKRMQTVHLKAYTFASLVRSDVIGRAAPWTEQMLRHRVFRNDLNTRWQHVASVALSWLLLGLVPAGAWFAPAAEAAVVLALVWVWLNRPFLAFVRSQCPWPRTIQIGLITWWQYVVSAVGLAIGVIWWLTGRHARAVATGQP